MKSYRYILKNLDCAACGKKIEDRIAKEKQYIDVNVNFSTLKLSFKTNKENPKQEIIKIIKEVEPEVEVLDIDSKNNEKEQRNYMDILRIALGLEIYVLSVILNIDEKFKIALIIISVLLLLSKTIKKALSEIKRRVLDENLLITVSVIGACFVGKTFEGIMVITLYEIGKILESKAVNKTRKSISNLMNIKPEYANLKKGKETLSVNPEEVSVGDTIIVKMGEKVPLDGTVLNGEAQIDNSALTGESKLLSIKKGDIVLSGSINIQGLLEIKVDKSYENSTVSKILNLVENATDKKAKTENFVSKAAKIYTPIVLALALLVAIFMPILIKDITYSESIYKALIFLVISCPCSIAISVPLSYFSGIGKASRRGILIKGSNYLDALKDINQIIFDKTGTITTGNFEVKEIQSLSNKYDKKQILEYFVIGESLSNHPIAKSILQKAKKEKIEVQDNIKIEYFKEIAGKGLEYKLENKIIKIGNKSLVNLSNANEEEGTFLYLKIDDEVVGKIWLLDEIKKDAKSTIKTLSNLGIKTKMFTGDKEKIANKIAKEVGINNLKAEMLPQDKYEELEKILESNKNKNLKVAYVGDGINDSPVLARSDIGISMGGIGSSSAIEASDIVVMTDELERIVEAINISKKTNRIIKENLIFSIGVKLLILILSVLGIADMWEAVFADVGTTLITIFNTIRILK